MEDNAEQTSTDRLVEEIKMLKAGVAAERMRSSHIVEALEVSKGSAEEVKNGPAKGPHVLSKIFGLQARSKTHLGPCSGSTS